MSGMTDRCRAVHRRTRRRIAQIHSDCCGPEPVDGQVNADFADTRSPPQAARKPARRPDWPISLLPARGRIGITEEPSNEVTSPAATTPAAHPGDEHQGARVVDRPSNRQAISAVGESHADILPEPGRGEPQSARMVAKPCPGSTARACPESLIDQARTARAETSAQRRRDRLRKGGCPQVAAQLTPGTPIGPAPPPPGLRLRSGCRQKKLGAAAGGSLGHFRSSIGRIRRPPPRTAS